MHSSSPIGDVSVGAAALTTPVTLAHSPCFSSAIGVFFARRSAAEAWFAGSDRPRDAHDTGGCRR